MRKRAIVAFLTIIILMLSAACAEKAPEIVPEEVDAEIASAEAAYDELLELKPPFQQTFYYRTYIKEAMDAREAGDYQKAVDSARKAREQASLTRDMRLQQLKALKKELDTIKKDIEALYLPRLPLVNAYWDASDAINEAEYEKAKPMVESLKEDIAQERKMSYVAEKRLIVTAPKEYVRRWGNVRMYKEITPEGLLKEIVGTVPPNAEVMYIRVELFARGKTFYLVEIPGTGIQGWMAEQYVAPGRASRD